MEISRNSELAEVIAKIGRWAREPGSLSCSEVDALSDAVRQLQDASGPVSNVDDDLIVEEATPHRSG